MKPKYKHLKSDILFEQNEIERVISKIKEVKGTITEINIAALAAYLMNFYTGIENIMKRCSKEYYKKIPKGNNWHKQLLQQSRVFNKNKVALFNEDIINKLYNYLLFRHYFIHGYGFRLDWNKMKSLVDDIEALWIEIKSCIADFIEKI